VIVVASFVSSTVEPYIVVSADDSGKNRRVSRDLNQNRCFMITSIVKSKMLGYKS
jgi:hypothetical protein